MVADESVGEGGGSLAGVGVFELDEEEGSWVLLGVAFVGAPLFAGVEGVELGDEVDVGAASEGVGDGVAAVEVRFA